MFPAREGSISDERVGELCKPSLSKAWQLVSARLSVLAHDTTVAAFDIMNGATFGKVRDVWTHSDKGYWDFAGKHLATEVSAEMFAAHISSSQARETAIAHLSESCSMFETMLKEAL